MLDYTIAFWNSHTEMASSTDDEGDTALAPLPDNQANTSIPRRRGYSVRAGASTVGPACHEQFIPISEPSRSDHSESDYLAQSDYSVLAQNMRGTAASKPRSLPAPRVLSPRRPPFRRSCLTSLTNQSVTSGTSPAGPARPAAVSYGAVNHGYRFVCVCVV